MKRYAIYNKTTGEIEKIVVATKPAYGQAYASDTTGVLEVASTVSDATHAIDVTDPNNPEPLLSE